MYSVKLTAAQIRQVADMRDLADALLRQMGEA